MKPRVGWWFIWFEDERDRYFGASLNWPPMLGYFKRRYDGWHHAIHIGPLNLGWSL